MVESIARGNSDVRENRHVVVNMLSVDVGYVTLWAHIDVKDIALWGHA